MSDDSLSHFSEQTLLNAIDQVGRDHPVVVIRYRDGPDIITQNVRHLVGLPRDSNYDNMYPDQVIRAVSQVGSFIRDVYSSYYHSPVHGIVRIYNDNDEWLFHRF